MAAANTHTVTLYTLPKCGKCDSAKEKIEILKKKGVEVEYEVKPYEKYINHHDGWKNDESIDVLTARHYYGEHAVPLIRCDGHMYDYPGFMKVIKKS